MYHVCYICHIMYVIMAYFKYQALHLKFRHSSSITWQCLPDACLVGQMLLEELLKEACQRTGNHIAGSWQMLMCSGSGASL